MSVFGVDHFLREGSRQIVRHIDHGPAGDLRVGHALARSRDELIDIGRVLGELLEPASAGLVTEAVRFIENHVSRIAVIGQIKAGKSSFINALVQMPELLPTDVNPWTTALTHLQFRGLHPHVDAARFQFFSAEEWQQLAEGGGRLRELTEKLVPGFELDLLRQHVARLKEKAARRLGPTFVELLGQTHAFEQLSPAILKQYVCSGDEAGFALPSDLTGRYSDITKTAEIYLPEGPFEVPITLIDTPGTNDPFLVRDEITRRALDQADIYIVVLTARQALSASDIALLRILRGLHKERIIVFLNRIDELREIAGDSEKVADAVRSRLVAEFPGSEIPLVVGSAWWANCALTPHMPDYDQCLGRRAMSYFELKNILPRDELEAPLDTRGGHASAIRNTLFEASGLKQVYRALDDLLNASQSAYVLRQLAASFIELSRVSESSVRQELQGLSETNSTVLAKSEHWDQELARLRQELLALQQIGEVISAASDQFQQDMMAIVTEEMKVLESRLYQTIDLSAKSERDALVQTLKAGASPSSWAFQSLPLRRQLAQEFTIIFNRTEARLNELRQSVLPQLQGLLSALTSSKEISLLADVGHRPVPPPPMTPLARYVALDLDSSWWSLFWRRRPDPRERGAELERLIGETFHVLADELVRVTQRNLVEHVEIATKWSFGICNTIAQSIMQRRRHLMQHFESLKTSIEGTVESGATSEQQHYIDALDKRLQQTVTLRKRLVVIGGDISRGLGAAK